MIDDLLDRFEKLWNRREQAKATSFEDLVVMYADGKDPGEKRTAEVLVATGKTPADLRSAVARKQQRRTAHVSRQIGLAAPAEIERLHAVIVSASAKRDAGIAALQAEFEAVAGPAEQQERAQKLAFHEGQKAETYLRDTADPAHVQYVAEKQAEATAIRQRIGAAETAALKARRRAAEIGEHARNLRGGNFFTGDDSQTRNQGIEDAWAEAKRCEQEASRIRTQELEPLEREIATLEAKLLEP